MHYRVTSSVMGRGVKKVLKCCFRSLSSHSTSSTPSMVLKGEARRFKHKDVEDHRWSNGWRNLFVAPLQHIEVNKLIKGRPLDNLEFIQWMKQYCDTVNGGLLNYNPLERRDACKGGKEAGKKCPPSQCSTKGSTGLSKALSSHNVRRNDVSSVNPSNQSVKLSKPPSPVSAYGDQITELKLNVDSLEKERDFYFTKLRDIETLCQSLKIENPMVVGAIKRILYATDDDASVVTEAKAKVSLQQNEAEVSSSAAECQRKR